MGLAIGPSFSRESSGKVAKVGEWFVAEEYSAGREEI